VDTMQLPQSEVRSGKPHSCCSKDPVGGEDLGRIQSRIAMGSLSGEDGDQVVTEVKKQRKTPNCHSEYPKCVCPTSSRPKRGQGAGESTRGWSANGRGLGGTFYISNGEDKTFWLRSEIGKRISRRSSLVKAVNLARTERDGKLSDIRKENR
jgi:hypothetical protein